MSYYFWGVLQPGAFTISRLYDPAGVLSATAVTLIDVF
jgi:hypothetical protein